MENLLNYVHLRKDIPFNERGLNPVDLLVLSELAYVDLEQVLQQGPLTISQACTKYLASYSLEDLKTDFAFSKSIPELVFALQDNDRFDHIKIEKYKQVNNDEKQIQFGAMLFVMENGSRIVSYRGTDGSITGWKENMQMTYQDDLPCQRLALHFLQESLESIPERSYFFGLYHKKEIPPIYLTGHSKGGNLAMYAMAKLEKNADWITKAVVFDAPGFRPSFYQNVDSNRFLRMVNYKPQDSVIGCLLTHKEKAAIVVSNAEGLLQHDAFSWSVKWDGLVLGNHLSKRSKEILNVIDHILLQKEDDQKKEYIDLIFSILDTLDITKVSGLNDIGFKQMIQGFIELKNRTPDERKFIFEIINFLRKQTLSWIKGQKNEEKLDSLG